MTAASKNVLLGSVVQQHMSILTTATSATNIGPGIPVFSDTAQFSVAFSTCVSSRSTRDFWAASAAFARRLESA